MEGTESASNPPLFQDVNPNSLEPKRASGNESPLVARLRKLIYRRILVGVSDGRFFLGLFYCIDKQGNIILQDAVEHRSTRRSPSSPTAQRCLGLILIPASCRSSCHVECVIDEQMALLSLNKYSHTDEHRE